MLEEESKSSEESEFEEEEMSEEIYDDDYKKKIRYEYLITISFWLSIHWGHIEITNYILNRNSLMKHLVATIYSNQNDLSPNKSMYKENDDLRMSKKLLTNSPPKDNNDFSNTYQDEKRQSKKQLSMQDPKKSQFLSQKVQK